MDRPQIVFFIEAGFHALEVALFLQLLQFFFQLLDFLLRCFLFALEVGALGKIEARQQFDNFFIAQALVHFVEVTEIFFQPSGKL